LHIYAILSAQNPKPNKVFIDSGFLVNELYLNG